MHGSVHEVVVDNGILSKIDNEFLFLLGLLEKHQDSELKSYQHPDVVSGELLNTEVLLVRFNCGAIVRGQVVLQRK